MLMPLPDHTESKTASSSYAPITQGSTREHIHTLDVTVPDWQIDFAHVTTMQTNVTQAGLPRLPPSAKTAPYQTAKAGYSPW